MNEHGQASGNRKLIIREFTKTAQKYPAKIAIYGPDHDVSFGSLQKEISALKKYFVDRGIQSGSIVAVYADNVLEFITTYLVAADLELCIVPIDKRLSFPEINEILQDCRPDYFIINTRNTSFLSSALQQASFWFHGSVSHEYISQYNSLIVVERGSRAERNNHIIDSDFVILYTSGSTGKPKGIAFSQAGLGNKILNWNSTLHVNDEDVFLCTLTLCHCYGMYVHTLASLLAGATLYLPNIDRLSPRKRVKMIMDKNITIFGTLPYMYEFFIDLSRVMKIDLSKTRYLISGSAPLYKHTAKKFKDCFGKDINQVYGLTEIGLITFNREVQDANSIGKLTSNMEAKILRENGTPCDPDEVGELVVKCNSRSRGYLNPDEHKLDFVDDWLYTKDLVKRDRNGDFHFCGRKSQFINVGGNKVNPIEVENVILQVENVEEVAVLAHADDISGESVLAAVVLKQTDSASETLEKIRNICDRTLTSYKRPGRITIVKSIPKSPLGKVLKSKIEISECITYQ